MTGLGYGPIAFDGLGHLFIAVNGSSIAEYTTSGSLLNPSLITGLYDAAGLAVDNQGHLFVSQEGINVVSQYTTSGTLVNASVIQGLDLPSGLALDGQGHLFVVDQGNGRTGEYTTSGDVVNASLITGVGGAYNIAVVVPEPSTISLALAAGCVFARRLRKIPGHVEEIRG